MKKDLIVMIGYRGSGKSTLAKNLAEKIKWKYESSDQFIEKEVGSLLKWIPLHGWPAFRKKEHLACQVLSQQTNAVIDLGGGAVENQKNLELFLNRAMIFWIDADIEILIKRLHSNKSRPLLNHLIKTKNTNINWNKEVTEETMKKYQERLPLYQKFSHHRIENNKSLEVAFINILQVLEKYHIINK